MRWLLLITGAAAVASCSPSTAFKSEDVKRCEGLLLPTLKAPSTYKLIDAMIGTPDRDRKKNVFLEYDAVNSYNAPIRGKFWCVIDKDGGVREGGGDVESDADNLMAMADNLADRSAPAQQAPTGINPFSEPEEVPVCDRPDSPEKFALMNEIGVDCLGE